MQTNDDRDWRADVQHTDRQTDPWSSTVQTLRYFVFTKDVRTRVIRRTAQPNFSSVDRVRGEDADRRRSVSGGLLMWHGATSGGLARTHATLALSSWRWLCDPQ